MRQVIELDENPLERETERLLDRDGNKDLHSVTKMAGLSRQKNFQQLQSFIEQIAGDPDKQFNPESLKQQLEYLQLLYKAFHSKQPINDKLELINAPAYRYRTIQANINMKLKSGVIVKDAEIRQLCEIAQHNPKLREEVLLKLVGCRFVERMQEITKQEIKDLTPQLKKQAIKLQIAADWKYFIGQENQSISFKTDSVKAWEIYNQPSRIQEAKRELNELTKLCKGKKIESPYINKLITIRKIIELLGKTSQFSQKQLMERMKKKMAIEKVLPYTIEGLTLLENQKIKDSKSISGSVLKKKGLIQERKQIGRKFYEDVNKNNFLYANCVPQNRFQFQLTKKLGLILGVMERIYKKRFRTFLDNTKKKAEQKKSKLK